ncbi:hypothetical protein BT96DRAFT_1018258 [Gymnopus androsaceus JB14]|uniref:Uncharacterized protein n=1 Tax=Gymnopus androsaceus JB14 TaxID=1447944 RepID=A0A6A4HSE2_9AGAR|nr:hypothetical protein BT96DRAFT_1018258 [Gymnopus androsaceus JB14]
MLLHCTLHSVSFHPPYSLLHPTYSPLHPFNFPILAFSFHRSSQHFVLAASFRRFVVFLVPPTATYTLFFCPALRLPFTLPSYQYQYPWTFHKYDGYTGKISAAPTTGSMTRKYIWLQTQPGTHQGSSTIIFGASHSAPTTVVTSSIIGSNPNPRPCPVFSVRRMQAQERVEWGYFVRVFSKSEFDIVLSRKKRRGVVSRYVASIPLPHSTATWSTVLFFVVFALFLSFRVIHFACVLPFALISALLPWYYLPAFFHPLLRLLVPALYVPDQVQYFQVQYDCYKYFGLVEWEYEYRRRSGRWSERTVLLFSSRRERGKEDGSDADVSGELALGSGLMVRRTGMRDVEAGRGEELRGGHYGW